MVRKSILNRKVMGLFSHLFLIHEEQTDEAQLGFPQGEKGSQRGQGWLPKLPLGP